MLQQCPVKYRSITSLGIKTTTPMPSLTAGRLSEMDEDAKVHWAETVDKPRYRQFTISEEPWSLWWDNRNRLHDQNIRSLALTCRFNRLQKSSPPFGWFSSRGEAPSSQEDVSSPTTTAYQTAWLIQNASGTRRAERHR
jgi:hypothetical protein